jgi:hypothetical protein
VKDEGRLDQPSGSRFVRRLDHGSLICSAPIVSSNNHERFGRIVVVVDMSSEKGKKSKKTTIQSDGGELDVALVLD